MAYEIAATFCHFAPDFQRILTPGKWPDCLQRFFRGLFDAELAEKVAHKDPKLTVESFRFLELFGAKLQQCPASSVAQAAQEEAASLLQKERSDMEWVVRKLSSEVAAWNAYNELVRKWLCTTSLERSAKVTEIERKNHLLIEKELDLRCPCTEVPTGEFLGVHLQSAVQAWAEAHEAAMSDVTQVYWIDFTIPGYNFNRSALHALSKLAEGMAANPERTVGIILAPAPAPMATSIPLREFEPVSEVSRIPWSIPPSRPGGSTSIWSSTLPPSLSTANGLASILVGSWSVRQCPMATWGPWRPKVICGFARRSAASPSHTARSTRIRLGLGGAMSTPTMIFRSHKSASNGSRDGRWPNPFLMPSGPA